MITYSAVMLLATRKDTAMYLFSLRTD